MLTDFRGKVAVVTGAASGLGEALARGFAAEGMRVACVDIDLPGATAVAESLPTSLALEVDVSEASAVAHLADTVFAEWGQVDLLCNNAGVFQGGVSWERSLDDWEWALGVNLYGVIHAISSFLPRMIAQGTDGHVVNTSSIAAFVSSATTAPYSVSKAAVFSLTECLAHDLEAVGSRIGASVLTPSAFDTGIAGTAAVRPERFGSDDSEGARAMNDALASITRTGLRPDEVVAPVLAGVAAGTFLIPTRPSFQQQLDDRHGSLRDRRLPRPTIVD